MNKIIVGIVIFLIIITLNYESKAQFTFSVSPGIQVNGASFGYKYNNFVSYFGLQVFSGSSNFTETGMKYDYGNIVPYEDTYKYSLSVFLPTVGLKYFFKKTNKIVAYGNIAFTQAFLSAKIEDSNDSTANDDLKKTLKGISAYGGQLGFGVEYYFDDNFSIGGEFGIRQVHLKYKNEQDEIIYSPTGITIPYKRTYEAKYNLNPTYIKITLNYYFGK